MISNTTLRKQAPALLAASILLLMPFTARALDLIYIDIADTSTSIPGAGGTFTSFSSPEINGYTVAFQGSKSGYTGIFTSSGGALTGVVDTTTNVPNALTPFTSFSGFSLDSKQVAFNGSSSGNQGIYLTSPTGLSTVVDLNTAIPNGTGSFTSLSAPSLSQGNLAFIGGGASSQQGVYTTYNGLHVAADTNTAIPNGTGNFVAGAFALASQSFADTNFVGGGSAGQNGIYDNYYYGSDTKIVNTSTPIPGGTGNFSTFGSAVHGSYGDFVWVAGSSPGTGIYTNSGGPISVLANGTTSIPGGTGNFITFGAASHSNSDVAFIGNGGSGQVGLYTNTGGSLVNVIAKGSILNGKTVTSVSTGAAESINNGNLVFNVTFSDGSSAIYAAEQNYGWSANTSGTWDNPANWSFGVKPGTMLYTNINPDSGILLTGPTTSTAIRGLTIGANNNGIAELRLQPGAQLSVNESTNVNNNGQLTLNGSVFYSNYNLSNAGIVNLSGGQTAGGAFYNNGTVYGSGTVGNYFQNENYGWSVGYVQSLNAIVHFANGFDNYGEYQIINSQVQLDGDVNNYDDQGNGAGRIDVRNSIIQFTKNLSNRGQLNFSFGTSDVFGTVTNQGNGQVIVSGNSNVTFYDAVTNNGTIFRISPGSTAIFFGPVNGTSSFTGSGTKIFEGGYTPALAAVSVDGPVTFDTTNTLNIQLGGPIQGSGYAHVQVNGQLFLGGTLNVSLINGYVPNVGSTFDVLDWTTATGTFASTPSATQQGILKLFWNTTQTPSNVNLTLTHAYYDIQSGTYSQALTGGGVDVVKSTTGTAILTGPYSATGALTVVNGTLQFAATSGARRSSAITLKPGTVSVTNAGSALDISNHDMMVTGLTGSTYGTLQTLVMNGIANLGLGNGNPAGPQITSSSANNNPNASTFILPYSIDNTFGGGVTGDGSGVGFSDPNYTNGIAVTKPGTAFVKYLYFGDLNLDGVVNAADIFQEVGNVGLTTPGLADYGTSYLNGDLLGSGSVTTADIFLVVGSLGFGSGGPNNGPLGGLDSGSLGIAATGSSSAATPEPASLALLGLGTVGLLIRRKRR